MGKNLLLLLSAKWSMQAFSLLFSVLSVSVPCVVRSGYTFAALGNWGFPSQIQLDVAKSLKKVASDYRVAMIVSPGSNFQGGVSSIDDPAWKTLFSDVYSDENGTLKVPFFTVLGVEDWAGDYNSEIKMTDRNTNSGALNENAPQWSIPNWWYHYITHFQTGEGTGILGGGHEDYSVGFIFIDTWILSSQFPVTEVSERAWSDLTKTLEIAPAVLDYIIVVGDKPVFSSGASKGDSYLAYYLLPLLKKAKVDAYIAGYDFDMEAIRNDDLTQINCGNGAMSSSQYASIEGSVFFSGEAGFCLCELTSSGMKTKFIKASTNEVLYTLQTPLVERPQRTRMNTMNYLSQLPPVEFVPVPEMTQMPTHEAFIRVIGVIGIVIELIFCGLGAGVLIQRTYKG